jgi:hypothetical protein
MFQLDYYSRLDKPNKDEIEATVRVLVRDLFNFERLTYEERRIAFQTVSGKQYANKERHRRYQEKLDFAMQALLPRVCMASLEFHHKYYNQTSLLLTMYQIVEPLGTSTDPAMMAAGTDWEPYWDQILTGMNEIRDKTKELYFFMYNRTGSAGIDRDYLEAQTVRAHTSYLEMLKRHGFACPTK